MAKKRSEKLLQVTQNLAAVEGEGSASGTKVLSVEAVNELIESLRVGDMGRFDSALSKLGVHSESDIYQKVGQMARTLHDSLREFKTSLSRESVTMHSTCIPDATNQLEQVIKLTFDAAQGTMNLMDEQSAILRQLREAVSRSSQASGFATALTPLLERLGGITTEVVMAQAYQDLTGQALGKVVKLVSSLESQLLGLVKLFGHQEDANTGALQVEAPQSEESKVNQDQADDLLKSFGF